MASSGTIAFKLTRDNPERAKDNPTVAEVLASKSLSEDAHNDLLEWATEPEKEYRGLLSARAALRLIARGVE